jgi:hypothetical protein
VAVYASKNCSVLFKKVRLPIMGGAKSVACHNQPGGVLMNTRSPLRYTFGALALFAAAAVFPAASHADTFDLTSCHIQPQGCGAPPFGTVTLTQSGANVNVTVTLADSNKFAQTGALDQVLFAFNGSGITTNDIVNETGAVLQPGVTLQGISGTFTGPNGAPDFGTFGFAIECVDGSNCNGATTINTISFTVNNALVSDLTAANSTGTIFVADVLIGSSGLTGVVDASTASVPGPIVGAGMPGILMACGGLVALARRRRQKTV